MSRLSTFISTLTVLTLDFLSLVAPERWSVNQSSGTGRKDVVLWNPQEAVVAKSLVHEGFSERHRCFPSDGTAFWDEGPESRL